MNINDIKEVVNGALSSVEQKSAAKLDETVKVLEAKLKEVEAKNEKETNDLRMKLDSKSASGSSVGLKELAVKRGVVSARGTDDVLSFKANEITTSRADISGAAGGLGVIAHIDPARTPGVKTKLVDFVRSTMVNAISYEFGRAKRPNGSTIGTQTEAGSKNLGQLQWEYINKPFVTFAGYVRASYQGLKRIPELLGEIQYELEVDHDKVINTHITSTMLNDPDIQTVDNTDYGAVILNSGMDLGSAYIVALRKAITALDAVEATASVIVMNPADVETLELGRSTTGNYLVLQSVAAGGEQAVFKVPYIKSNQIAAGTALVADTSTMVFVKNENMSIRTSDSDADNFSKNLVSILLESSGSLCIKRPDFIVKVTLPVVGDLT